MIKGPFDEDYYLYEADGGLKSADQMFATAESSNWTMTWIIRYCSYLFSERRQSELAVYVAGLLGGIYMAYK